MAKKPYVKTPVDHGFTSAILSASAKKTWLFSSRAATRANGVHAARPFTCSASGQMVRRDQDAIDGDPMVL